jgi:RNA-directed DNA polymerase
MQFDLFNLPKVELPKIKLEELFEAYFACRSNKRNTINAIAFEVDYESNLVQLCEEINNGTYQIGKSIAPSIN